MGKLKNALLLLLVLALILGAGYLPRALGAMQDRTTFGQIHKAEITPVDLILSSPSQDLTALEKLFLFRDGVMFIQSDNALTEDQIPENILAAKERIFEDLRVLFPALVSNPSTVGFLPFLNYYPENPEINNMLYLLQIECIYPSYEVLNIYLDADTGALLSMNYFTDSYVYAGAQSRVLDLCYLFNHQLGIQDKDIWLDWIDMTDPETSVVRCTYPDAEKGTLYIDFLMSPCDISITILQLYDVDKEAPSSFTLPGKKS